MSLYFETLQVDNVSSRMTHSFNAYYSNYDLIETVLLHCRARKKCRPVVWDK